MYLRRLLRSSFLFATTFLSSGASFGFAARCPALIKRIGLRIVLKDRKFPLKFGSSTIFISAPAYRSLIERVTLAAQQSMFRETARTDHTVSLVDGPIAKWSERRYGTQKELTIPASIAYRLVQSAALGLLMHALFTDSILDPLVWAQKKEELQNLVGTQTNHASLEYYLRRHPDFWDLHREFLNAKKTNPDTSIIPYLVRVRERMNEIILVQSEISSLLPKDNAAATAIEDYAAVNTAIQDSNLDQSKVERLSSVQQAIAARISFAETLAIGENLSVPQALKPVQAALQNMFANLNTLESSKDHRIDGFQVGSEWSLNSAKSPATLAKIDAAICAIFSQLGNQYWQMDVHMNSDQRGKWEAEAPQFKEAIDKLLRDEQAEHEQIQSIQRDAKHPFFAQTALKEYAAAKLNFEWQRELHITSSAPEAQSNTAILTNLRKQLEAKGQLNQ